MAQPRYTVGIDLGTTNSAVAYADVSQEFVEGDPIRTFVVQQLVAPGVVEGRSLLPSSLYFPSGPEMPAGSTGLPWDPTREHVVGYLARSLGARVPGRLVHSAKSWLCHPDVDRRGPILPWAAGDDVPHLSPVQASAEYLDHIREAWNFKLGRSDGERLEAQEVYLTVPASFDAVARQLTLEAAREAGLADVTLLEEPQAAFYCWIGTSESRWREVLGQGKVVLVCDVGGGTSDFTLIVVSASKSESGPTEPVPVRVAVGDHLLLGGDNMDLALAHLLEPRLVGKKKLSPWEWGELVHASREAKEEILRKPTVNRFAVSILGRSSKVVGGTMTTQLTREELVERILEGFFPFCRADDSPSTERGALVELGLPYAADPAVTRHLATFLRDSAPAVADALGGEPRAMARPDVVLFNGGVFRPSLLRDRLVDVVRSWFPDEPGWQPNGVVNASPDLSVARGAAYYGLVRRGYGIRITGGAARAYYIGLGEQTQVSKVLCVVPRGMEEGARLDVSGRRFSLILGQAVRFPLYASSMRIRDRVGDVLDREARGLVALPSLRTVLDQGDLTQSVIEVGLSSQLTQTGTLELACRSEELGRSWQLELELRSAQSKEPAAVEVAATGQRSPQTLFLAQNLIRAVFSPSARALSGLPKDPGSLRKRLEEALEAKRESWIPRTLRTLLETLLGLRDGRFIAPVHEARWLNLAGFCI
ncbi:MAG: Hsp70 family protein, partial [Candidatus Riflebacteria bacterium]|nr:Hsp70 family protein [Candidatus Riflebacteria bacterium]